MYEKHKNTVFKTTIIQYGYKIFTSMITKIFTFYFKLSVKKFC